MSVSDRTYLIFVTGTTLQIVMWRNSPHDKLSFGEMSPHGKYGDKSVIWRNAERKICHVEKLLHMRNVETNLFVTIYAVL